MTAPTKASSLDVGHRDVLAAAVRAIGGTDRPGQVEMADAVAESLDSNNHLLVQAGTGTGWLCRPSWPTTTFPRQSMQLRRLPGSGQPTQSSKVVPTTSACCEYEKAPLMISKRSFPPVS